MRTLILLKPWSVSRGLVGEILSRFEKRGIRLAGIKVTQVDRKHAEMLYAVHKGKPFYEDLIEHIMSSPIVAAVLDVPIDDPDTAVALIRKIVGATDPAKAEVGTIRGDYGLRIDRNVIHASDSPKSAAYEIPIFFNDNELVNY
jgi:nucleoside-diphosphate kinase